MIAHQYHAEPVLEEAHLVAGISCQLSQDAWSEVSSLQVTRASAIQLQMVQAATKKQNILLPCEGRTPMSSTWEHAGRKKNVSASRTHPTHGKNGTSRRLHVQRCSSLGSAVPTSACQHDNTPPSPSTSFPFVFLSLLLKSILKSRPACLTPLVGYAQDGVATWPAITSALALCPGSWKHTCAL